MRDLVFVTPYALLALLVLPAIVWWRLRHDAHRLGFNVPSEGFAGSPTIRQRLLWLPSALRVLSLALVVVAIARPQKIDVRESSVEGIDIMLALDMSGSMAAVDLEAAQIRSHQRSRAEDPPNRFDHAIRTLKSFVSDRSRDRIGMVVFAHDAYIQFPLTLDYATVQTILDRLELESINPNATAIGNALGLSVRGLMDSTSASKAIILITDGKQQGGNISPTQAAAIAADEGIRVFSILVGSGGQTMVPTNLRQPNQLSRYTPQQYPIDPELLQDIAGTTNGGFYRASQPHQLRDGLQEILDELETTQLNDVSAARYTDLYPQLAVLALLLLLFSSALEALWLRRIV